MTTPPPGRQPLDLPEGSALYELLVLIAVDLVDRSTTASSGTEPSDTANVEESRPDESGAPSPR